MAKIMLVEDDNNLREIYEARLAAEGYEIVTARDGEEALAVAVRERPDLVISDVMMPKISGFDMLDILRSTPETKDVKVIMMTALSQVEDKERATKLGADRYLVKSQVTLEDVAKVAREVLEGTPVGGPAATAADEPSAIPTGVPQAAVAAAPIADPVVAAPEPMFNTPVSTPAVDPITMPAPDPVIQTAPVAVIEPDQAAVQSTDMGVTDLSAPTTDVSTPVAVDPVAPPATNEPDNDVVRPAAEVWSVDMPATPPVDESVVASQPAAPANQSVAQQVSAAEAVVNAAGGQSLQDEEAAIAKQIETMIDNPAPAAEEPTESTESATEEAPVATDTPAPAIEAPIGPTMPTTPTEPVRSVGERVIQPIVDPEAQAKPDIHELVAQEEANEAAHIGGSIIAPTNDQNNASKPAATDASTNSPVAGGIDPNSLAL